MCAAGGPQCPGLAHLPVQECTVSTHHLWQLGNPSPRWLRGCVGLGTSDIGITHSPGFPNEWNCHFIISPSAGEEDAALGSAHRNVTSSPVHTTLIVNAMITMIMNSSCILQLCNEQLNYYWSIK